MAAREARQREGHALDGQVGAELVDGRELGLHVGPELLLALRDGAQLLGVGAVEGDRVDPLRSEGGARIRVEGQELEEDRRARARRPRDDEGRCDGLVRDGRVRVARVRDEEPRAQAAQELLSGHQATEGVELARRLDLRHDRVEAAAPVAVEVAEIVETARRLDRRVHEGVGIEGNQAFGPTD